MGNAKECQEDKNRNIALENDEKWRIWLLKSENIVEYNTNLLILVSLTSALRARALVSITLV